MRGIFAVILLSSSVALAAQEPRSVAEAALAAWDTHDARGLSAVAHPELVRRIRDGRLIQFYVANRPSKASVASSGSDADVVALFCEALQAIVPPRDSQLEYFDRYVETNYKGDLAIVVFDSGWKRRSDGITGHESRKEIVLKKSGGDWKFLWSPAALIHVDLDWDPTKTNA